MLHFGFCLVYQDKEERYKHNTEYNGKYHSEENTRTDGLTARRARSACQHHRKHSQYKGEGSHQDRPETELGSMDGRLYQVSSLSTCTLANSTIKMAFFAASPTSITKPIWK